ncbi:MAG: type II TA system antitoxin MqsA family protein [Sterolibacterium sp.]|jgi:putative zinc finger/helix-turn-helix YgiT family protein
MCDSLQIKIRDDRTAKFSYLKRQHVLNGQEDTVCLACGTGFYQPGQIERNNQRFARFSASLIKHIAPWEILALRETYLISQQQAAKIFRCGKTQFSKWERGEVAPTGTASLALREALENQKYMEKLAHQAGVKINTPKTSPADIKLSPRITSIGSGLVIQYYDETFVTRIGASDTRIEPLSPSSSMPWAKARNLVHPTPARQQ